MNEDDWIMGALAQREAYRPMGNDPWTNTMPQRPKPVEEDDRPNPLIPFSAWRSKPPKHTVADVAAQQIVETGPLGMGLGLATGSGLRALGLSPFSRSTVGGSVASAEPTEAQAAKKIKSPAGFAPTELRMGDVLTARGPPRGTLSIDDFGPPPEVSTRPINPMAVKGHNVPPKDYRMQFPQYATEYPPVGAPAGPFINEVKLKKYLDSGMDPDEAKAKAQYFEKLRTPQEDEFMRARKKVREDMQKEGYTPFFNPADRYHVDPANYPTGVDTMVVTDKVRANNMEKIDTPEARAALQAGFERGQSMPNTENWYAMGQLEQAFIDELGDVAGRKAFQDRFAGAMAATTGGADPTSNFLTAMYGNFLRERGKDVPGIANQHPSPIGGRFIQGNVDMHQQMLDSGVGNDFLSGDFPKRHNFSQNFTGNQNVGTIDEQMMGGFTGHWDKPLTMPTPGHYGLYEQVLREEAAKAGMSPQEYQAITWSGLKNMSTPGYTRGKSMIEHVNDSIERTARLTGLSREEVLKQGIIRSKIPLYALASGMAAPAAMGSLARQYDRKPEERI